MNRFKRTLPIVLSVAMVLQLGFTPAFAAEATTTTKTVTAFAELTEDEKSITLPLGSTEDEVKAALPKTLTAMVETVTDEGSTPKPPAEDSGKPPVQEVTPDEEGIATPGNATETVQSLSVRGTTTIGLSTVSGQEPAKSTTAEEQVAVTWLLAEGEVFSPETAGAFTYTASLSGSGYTLAEDVSLPEINVMVGAMAAVMSLDHDISTGSLILDTTDDGCSADAPHIVTGNSSGNKIEVTGGTHQIEIKDLKLEYFYGGASFCKFSIASGAAVHLTLEGTNTINTTSNFAGISVPEGATLVIEEDSTGTLNVTGDNYAAGIGGNQNASAGTITINGGTIVANGGTNHGAGIGGGKAGNGGIIEINGGMVTATGGGSSAGIGGGLEGNGGTITINGGTVTATGEGRGAGIGSGDRGKEGTVTIDGDAQVFATGGSDTTNGLKAQDIGTGWGGGGITVNREKGIIIEGSTGAVYGDVTLQEKLTIDAGKLLIIPEGASLDINGKEITNNGVVLCRGTVQGTVPGVWFSITSQPQDGTILFNSTHELSFVAEASEGTPTYQWYKNTSNSNSGGTPIDGATDSGYTTPSNELGTSYYYCVVMVNGVSYTSHVAAVTVILSSVASVGDTEYNTLQEAFDAVSNGSAAGTVKLLLDFPLTNVVTVNSGNITLNLDGKKISGDGIRVNSGAKLVVEDTSSGKTGKIEGTGSGSTIRTEGDVTINGGTVENTGGGTAIENASTGLVTISGTASVTSPNNAISLTGRATATANRLVIAGGTVKATGSGATAAILNNTAGGVSISGGAVEHTGGGTAIENTSTGLVTISGTASVASPNNAISLSGSTGAIENRLVITGGTVKATGSGATPAILNNSTGGVSISGGVVEHTGSGTAIENASTGGVTITGGAVVNQGGDSAVKNGSTGTVSFTGGLIWGDCDGGAIPYGMAWSVKGTETLPVDATLPAGKTFTISGGNTLTIPFGITLTNNGTIIAYGTLNSNGSYGTIAGSGKVELHKDAASHTLTLLLEGEEVPKAIFGQSYTLRLTVEKPAFAARAAFTEPEKAAFYLGINNTGTKIGDTVTFRPHPADTTKLVAEVPWTPTKVMMGTTQNIFMEYGKLTAGEDNLISPGTANGTVDVRGVAEVDNGGTKTDYSTLQEAITASADGSTVTLLEDINLGDTGVSIGDIDLTLDLNGKTLTSSGTYILVYGGDKTLTLQDSSATGGNPGTGKMSSPDGGAIQLSGTGTAATDRLVITGGTVEGTKSTIVNESKGTVNIAGGTVKTTGESSNTIFNSDTGAVNITGGTVEGTNGGDVIYNRSSGAVNITGGTVKGTNRSVAIYNIGTNGLVTISGTARVISDGTAAIQCHGGTGTADCLVITGGTVENTGENNGYAIWNTSSGGVKISGGTVVSKGSDTIDNHPTDTADGTLTITGGVVLNLAGKRAVYAESTTVSFTGGLIWGDCYGSIPAGMAWSVKGAETLPVNATLPAGEVFTIPADAALTIATGVTLTNNGIINVYGTLNSGAPTYGTITGSGTVDEDPTAPPVDPPTDPTFGQLYIGGNLVTLPADGETTYSNSNKQDSVWWLTCTGTKYSLTLNGADITNTDTSSDFTRGIDAKGDLELVLQKTNTVTAAANDLSYGIYVDGDLTVTGEGTLTATGGTASGSSYGVNVNGSLAVKNGCLKGIGGKAEMSEGVHADLYTSISGNGEIEGIGGEAFDSHGVSSKKTITVTGGKLTGTGGKAENYSYGVYTYPTGNDCNIILSSGSISGIGGDAYSSFGVCLNGGSIMMEGGSLTGTSGKALDISRGVIVKDLTISGGSLTGTGGTSEYFSGGITVNHNITANGGSLTGTGGKAEYNSIGVYCNLQNITVNGGSLTGIADSTANGTMSSNGSYGVFAAEGQVNFFKGIFKAQGNDYATASNDSSPDAGENQRGLVFNLQPSASKYRSNRLPVDPQGAFTMLDYVWSNTHKYLLLVDNSYSDPGVSDGGGSSSGATDDGGSSSGSTGGPLVKTSYLLTNGSAAISRSNLQALKEAGKSLTISNSNATLVFDTAAIQAILSGTTEKVTFSVTKAGRSKLSNGSRPAYTFTVKDANGKMVTNFGKGSVSVSIPYTLRRGEIAGNVQAIYVDDSGKMTWLTHSSYISTAKQLLFRTDHFSVFGVGYKKSPAFTDIGNHWAKDDIVFAVSRGLLTGTGNTTFSPDTSMTRGMFVTALGRLAGVDTATYSNTKFTDVAADAYYAPYVAWANANGILKGTTDTTFSPDTAITRQEMAVMLVNYSKAIGYKLPKVHAENTFADAGSIGAWAKDAVKQMQMAGVLMGKNGNKFDPTATATRAEVSAMLRRYVELVISSDTAKGWAMNDSGQWMYFENGKPVTGENTIDGTKYTFDQNGVTEKQPKN